MKPIRVELRVRHIMDGFKSVVGTKVIEDYNKLGFAFDEVIHEVMVEYGTLARIEIVFNPEQ